MRSLSVRKLLRRALTKVVAVHCRPARRCISSPLLRLEALEDRTAPATFTVMNTNDSGLGSLRQAILDANAASGMNTIAFNISGGGVHVIQPASPLAALTHAVVVDGSTQPGYAGVPLIDLNGGA